MTYIRRNSTSTPFMPWEAGGDAAAANGKRQLEDRRNAHKDCHWVAHQWVHVRRSLSDKTGFFARLLTARETSHYGMSFTVYLPVAMHGDCSTTMMVDQELIRPINASDFISGRPPAGGKDSNVRNRSNMEPPRDGRSPEAHAQFLEMCLRVLNVCKGDGSEESPATTRQEIQHATGKYPAVEVIETLQEHGHIDPETTSQGQIVKDRYYLTARGVTWRTSLKARFPGGGSSQRSANNGKSSAPVRKEGKSPANNGESPKAGTGAKRSQGTKPEPPSDTNDDSPSESNVTRTTARRSPRNADSAGRQTPTSKAGQSRRSTRGNRKRPSTTRAPGATERAASRTQTAGASDSTSETSEERESRESD